MLEWRRVYETELDDADHGRLRSLLSASFPKYATAIYATRSWASQRPEARLIGYRDGEAVAHLGFVRRFLRVGDAAVLAADTGLVALHPGLQGKGQGLAMMAEQARWVSGLGIPFGFLTCGAARTPFYERAGWRFTPTQVTMMLDADDSVRVSTGAAMYRPMADIDSFPEGKIVRDWYQI